MLRWGTCVGRAVLAIQASHITNANRVLVVILAMRTNLRFETATLNSAVELDQVVIANPFPASLAVPLIHLRQGDLPPGGCGSAMDDEQRDRATGCDGRTGHNIEIENG